MPRNSQMRLEEGDAVTAVVTAASSTTRAFLLRLDIVTTGKEKAWHPFGCQAS